MSTAALSFIGAPNATAATERVKDRPGQGTGRPATASVTSLPLHRLPLLVPVHPGESVDSWVEAIASCYETTTGVILAALGVPLPTPMPTVLQRLPAQALHRIADLSGVNVEEIRQAAGSGIPAAAWLPGCRSRYCPACLCATGGRWLMTWRAAITTTCVTHELLLADQCPTCGAFLRTLLTGQPSPLHCTARRTDGTQCGTDLSGADRLPIPGNLPDVQGWASAVLSLAAHDDEAASQLADVPAVLDWVERTLWTDDAGRRSQRRRYRDAATTASLLPDVAAILGTDDQAAIAHLDTLIRTAGPPYTVTPGGLSPRRLDDLTGPFPSRYRQAIDRYLDAPDRLRHRTTGPGTRRPNGVPPARVRSIPELLWPDWYARLLPQAGVLGDHARAAYASALLLPGLPARRLNSALAALNDHRRPAVLCAVLRAYPAEEQSTVLTLLTRLADYLDSNPPVIDYQRRRDMLDGHPLIGWKQWRTLAITTNTHPGREDGVTRTPPSRLIRVRRYLHVLLCGTDLTNPRHQLAWTSSADRSRYHAFVDAMTPTVRAGLHRYAHDLLTDLGIDEPVTWSPPAESG